MSAASNINGLRKRYYALEALPKTTIALFGPTGAGVLD